MFFVFGSQTEELTQALEYIQICWDVWKTLKVSGYFFKSPWFLCLTIKVGNKKHLFEVNAEVHTFIL